MSGGMPPFTGALKGVLKVDICTSSTPREYVQHHPAVLGCYSNPSVGKVQDGVLE